VVGNVLSQGRRRFSLAQSGNTVVAIDVLARDPFGVGLRVLLEHGRLIVRHVGTGQWNIVFYRGCSRR
jgi:hypothetical protein